MINQKAAELIQRREFLGVDGNLYPTNSNITEDAGVFLYDLIIKNRLKRSIEIGLAFGFSSLFICDAMTQNRGHHIIFDPYQNKEWHGIGLANLKECGFDCYEFFEEGSEIGLPRLMQHGTKIDFAFIDGLHTFDQTLLEFFFLNRMLEVGGILVFDDAWMPSIQRVLRYVTRYPAYEIHSIANPIFNIDLKKRAFSHAIRALGTFGKRVFDDCSLRVERGLMRDTRMVAVQKIAEDERDWKWFDKF